MSDGFCYVYVIATLIGGEPSAPVKIGISENPPARLAALQTASPHDLVMFCCLTMNREWAVNIERDAHEILAGDRMRGEWFSADPIQAAAVVCAWFGEAVELATEDNDLRTTLLERSGAVKISQRLLEYSDYLKGRLQ